MKREKTIEVAGLSITVKEISVIKLYTTLTGEKSVFTIPAVEAAGKLKDLVPLAIEGDLQDLLSRELFYDDLVLIFDAFKETNPAFFELARRLGLADALGGFVKTLLQTFSNRLAGSLNMDTGLEFGSTATATS